MGGGGGLGGREWQIQESLGGGWLKFVSSLLYVGYPVAMTYTGRVWCLLPMGGLGVWGATPMNLLKFNPSFLQSGDILW